MAMYKDDVFPGVSTSLLQETVSAKCDKVTEPTPSIADHPV